MKNKKQKRRNWIAVAAWNKKAGAFVNKKKKSNKYACRGSKNNESKQE